MESRTMVVFAPERTHDVCLIYFTDWDGEQDHGGFCTRKNPDTSFIQEMLIPGAD